MPLWWQRELTIMSAAIRSPVGTVPLKAGVNKTLSPTLLPAQDHAVLRHSDIRSLTQLSSMFTKTDCKSQRQGEASGKLTL